MAKRGPTAEERQLIDAHDLYRALRKQHVRRTRIIGGRLYVGDTAGWVIWLVLLSSLLALVLGWLGVGVRVDRDAMVGVGLVVASLLSLAALGRNGKKEGGRAATSGPGPLRLLLTGLCLVLIGLSLAASRNAAIIFGWLLAMFGVVAATTGAIHLVLAALGRLFRKRSGPEELEPIQGGERPAA